MTDPPHDASGPVREVRSRILLVLGGLVAGFLLLELALQGIGAVRRLGDEPRRFTWRGDGTRVLTIGDSNTYGFMVEREQSYPAVFEQRWNLLGNARIEVMNLAHPGINSSQARSLLAATLGDLRPEVLFVMVGANDFWTLPEGEAPLWQRSRVMRLLTMVWFYFTRAAVVPAADHHVLEVGGKRLELHVTGQGYGVPDWDAKMLVNLRGIVETARAAGARVVLLTYAADEDAYLAVNHRIRRLAREEKVPLIDVGFALRRRCPAVRPAAGADVRPGARPERIPLESRCGLFLPDGHPTVAGYEAIAQVLIDAYPGLDFGH